MPPKLSTGGRADPPTEPRPAHNTWPIQNVSVAAWRARNTAAVVVRTTMSAVSCQSSRECCRNFGNVPATSGTFPKFPQGCFAIFRWAPSVRRGFAKSTLGGISGTLLFSHACAKDTGWFYGPYQLGHALALGGGMGACREWLTFVGQHGVCARRISVAQSRGTAAPPSRQLASLPSPFRAPSGPTVTVGWTFAEGNF